MVSIYLAFYLFESALKLFEWYNEIVVDWILHNCVYLINLLECDAAEQIQAKLAKRVESVQKKNSVQNRCSSMKKNYVNSLRWIWLNQPIYGTAFIETKDEVEPISSQKEHKYWSL